MIASMKWQDWTNVALGIWLAVSPWALGFAEQQPAMMNAVIFGLVLAVFSLLVLGGTVSAKEWINMISGLWLVLSPFVLGFTSNFHAAVNTMLIGVLAAVFAAWALSLDKEIGNWWHDHVTGH
ncbi:MAG: hypothetical protein A3H35_12725 [Betaproteobacteria bacterium RIFCSPLOWO2_02_FULL_62_17]|nr:MAG: hypothetical protein A3H35_12725 [Betaproteobacteria bacterium RIFCSPLOWO2_02_FULL_62_17]